jgi:Tol biopolymer transport system component
MRKIISTAGRRAVLATGIVALATATSVAAENWDDWSAASSIESLPGSSPVLNTPAIDGCASHSADGLTLVFNSNRAGTHDIYMATRSSLSEGFGAPVRLPAPVNTETFTESCPTLAGNHLYFSSTRDDPVGDIVVSRLGQNGWSNPENLGSNINRAGWLDEAADFYTDDEGRDVMVFSSRQPHDNGGKIYESVAGSPRKLVRGGPNSSAQDNRPSVTSDGLTIFFDSTRTGTLGGPDLYYATRSTTSEPFGPAIHLRSLSSPGFDARPFISGDGSFVTYSSNRSGSESPAPDIWFATRGGN